MPYNVRQCSDTEFAVKFQYIRKNFNSLTFSHLRKFPLKEVSYTARANRNKPAPMFAGKKYLAF